MASTATTTAVGEKVEGIRGGCGGCYGGSSREEGFNGVGDGVRVERRREQARTTAISVSRTSVVADISRNVRFRSFLVVSGRHGGLSRIRRAPWRELGELVDGRLCVLDQPVDGFARPVEAKPILDVVELDGGVGGETNAAVSESLGGANLAVAIFPAGGTDNVAASLHFDDLPAGAPHRARPPLRVHHALREPGIIGGRGGAGEVGMQGVMENFFSFSPSIRLSLVCPTPPGIQTLLRLLPLLLYYFFLSRASYS